MELNTLLAAVQAVGETSHNYDPAVVEARMGEIKRMINVSNMEKFAYDLGIDLALLLKLLIGVRQALTTDDPLFRHVIAKSANHLLSSALATLCSAWIEAGYSDTEIVSAVRGLYTLDTDERDRVVSELPAVLNTMRAE